MSRPIRRTGEPGRSLGSSAGAPDVPRDFSVHRRGSFDGSVKRFTYLPGSRGYSVGTSERENRSGWAEREDISHELEHDRRAMAIFAAYTNDRWYYWGCVALKRAEALRLRGYPTCGSTVGSSGGIFWRSPASVPPGSSPRWWEFEAFSLGVRPDSQLAESARGQAAGRTPGKLWGRKRTLLSLNQPALILTCATRPAGLRDGAKGRG